MNMYTKIKKMKQLTTLLLVLTCSFGWSQNAEKRMERIKNLRIAFLSTKLDLTTEEAEKFWPVFNIFDDKQVALQQQKRQLMQKLKSDNSETLSDKETMKLLDQSEEIETQLQNNRRQFVKDLQGVIPLQKILLLKKIEEDFKNTLLKQFKEKQNKFKE
jgi:hypothetical protein